MMKRIAIPIRLHLLLRWRFLLLFFSPVIDPLFAASSKSATPKADRVEIRINELHTALNITAAQEELWNNVAQVMRDNAKTMDALIASRKNAKPMNAVENFKSYDEIQNAQAAASRNSSRSSRLSTTACLTIRRRMLISYLLIATPRSQRQRRRASDHVGHVKDGRAFMRIKRFSSIPGNIVMTLVFALMIGSIYIAPAFGRDGDDRRGYYDDRRGYNTQSRYRQDRYHVWPLWVRAWPPRVSAPCLLLP